MGKRILDVSDEAMTIAHLADDMPEDRRRELFTTAFRLAGRPVPLSVASPKRDTDLPDGRFTSARKALFLQKRLDELHLRLAKAEEDAMAWLRAATAGQLESRSLHQGIWYLTDFYRAALDVEGAEARVVGLGVDARPKAGVIKLAERVAERARAAADAEQEDPARG